MMCAKRETDRETAVRTVSRAAAELILSLPVGSETTIAQVVGYYCEELGYEWGRIDGEMDRGWTKDGGKTFLITDDDLFEVQNNVIRELSGQRELDNSKYAMMEVGLPYNIPFVIREVPGNPIVRIDISAFRELGSTEITVFDGHRDNVRVREFSFPQENDRKEQNYTIPFRKIGMIRQVFGNPLFREEQEEGYEEATGIFVLDGYRMELIVFGEEEDYFFDASNLWFYEGHLKGFPQTEALLGAVMETLGIISHETGFSCNFIIV